MLDALGSWAMAGIFISYRREDTAPWAGRIYERLAQELPRDQIFMDVDNIAPGLDFVKELERQVGACDVLIAVIGKEWTESRNAKGGRRLDDPHDFVRIEIEAALERDIRVIPVLVDGVSMPPRDELPEKLQPLVRRHAVELTHVRFGSDVQRLMSALAPIVQRDALASPVSHQPGQSPLPRRGLLITWRGFGLSALALVASWPTLVVVVAGLELYRGGPPSPDRDVASIAFPISILASALLWTIWYLLFKRPTQR